MYFFHKKSFICKFIFLGYKNYNLFPWTKGFRTYQYLTFLSVLLLICMPVHNVVILKYSMYTIFAQQSLLLISQLDQGH